MARESMPHATTFGRALTSPPSRTRYAASVDLLAAVTTVVGAALGSAATLGAAWLGARGKAAQASTPGGIERRRAPAPELPRVLVIEDDEFTSRALVRHLRMSAADAKIELAIDVARDVAEARAFAREHCYRAASGDLSIPGVDGADLLAEIAEAQRCRTIVYSGREEEGFGGVPGLAEIRDSSRFDRVLGKGASANPWTAAVLDLVKR